MSQVTNLKILVFSDSHRSLSGMYEAIEAQCPDQVIHLGDLSQDAHEVSLAYPMLPFCIVPGNCDGWTTLPLQKLITLEGVRILLSHGHIWHVKSGYEGALAAARKAGAGILLFGHTHKALCQQMEDGLWVLNPGPSRSSFGLLLIQGGRTSCSILKQG